MSESIHAEISTTQPMLVPINTQAFGQYYKFTLYEAHTHYQSMPHCTPWRMLPANVLVFYHEVEGFCEFEDTGRIELHPGEALYVPANLLHRTGISTSGIMSHFHFSFLLFDSIEIPSMYQIPHILDAQHLEPLLPFCDSYSKIAESCNRNPNAIYPMLQIQAWGYSLLTALLSLSPQAETAEPRLSEILRIEPVLVYMHDHLSEIQGRGELAAVLGLSETRFHTVFKQIMGISPIQYLIDTRMKRAQQLLLWSDLPVNKIALLIGYNDIPNFTRQFTRKSGISPYQYRKNARQMTQAHKEIT